MTISNPTSYIDPKPFRFKQFEVHHHICSFKVNTDGVLLSAWVDVGHQPKTILDIGSGSGVMSLVLAQRYPLANVTGIDIHTDSIGQSNYSASISPFANRVQFKQADVRSFAPEREYDLIVCNPPFFIDATQSKSTHLATAKHTDTSFFSDLFAFVKRHLTVDGRFALVFPFRYEELLISLMQQTELYPTRITEVKSFEDKAPFNVMMEVGHTYDFITSETIHIYKRQGIYSDKYTQITKAFYLK